MKNIRLKSSALMIALVFGIIISGLIVGVVAVMGEHVKLSGQARDGKVAYRAALSGIEDGLMRYKYAKAENEISSLLGCCSNNQFNISLDATRPPKAYYSLNFSFNSISVYGNEQYRPSNAGRYNWLTSGNNPGNLEDFPKLTIDETLDINLSSHKELTNVSVYYSYPWTSYVDSLGHEVKQTVAGFFTAMNYRLVNVSGNQESQLLSELTKTTSDYRVSISIPAACQNANAECHLRIRPQAVNTGGSSSLDSAITDRMSGGLGSAAQNFSKYVYYGIETTPVVAPTSDVPGTLTITAVGYAGQAVRKLEAKIDASTGSYLGLFDFGIYCGDKCTGTGEKIND